MDPSEEHNRRRAARIAQILMQQNVQFEVFDVGFSSVAEAGLIRDAVVNLGYRAELHPLRERIRIFRDTERRAAEGEGNVVTEPEAVVELLSE